VTVGKAEQIGIFADNQPATPIVEEEKEIPPTPLEGERWVDFSNRDEFLYNGQGYFESVTCERLVKLMPDGSHFCQVLRKETPLIRIDMSPEEKFAAILEIAERLGPDYVQFVHDKLESIQSDFSPENKITWLAVRQVEDDLQHYQRVKTKPKKEKSQKQQQKELEESTEKERLSVTVPADKEVDDFIQELAQRANRFIKQTGNRSPLTPVEADALFKKRLIESKLNEILTLAGELGFSDEDGQGEEEKLFPGATDESATPTSEEVEVVEEFEVDAETEGVKPEGVATNIEIPMLLDGQQKEEEPCEAAKNGTEGETDAKSVENNDTSEPGIPAAESSTLVDSSPTTSEELSQHTPLLQPSTETDQGKESPAKTENRTLVELENGDFADVETGEVVIRANVIRLAASAELGELLPEQKKFEICDEESAAIFIGMVRRRQNNIVDALQFAASVINKNLSELNGLQGRFNYELKTTCGGLMKKKKDGSFDGKTFNTHKGKVFFRTFGGLDVYDKKEFQAWVAKQPEKECPDLGIEIVESWSKTVVELPSDNDAAVIEMIKEMCPEAVIHHTEKAVTREPNMEIVEAFVKDGKEIPGCRWIEPDELGEVTFGESTARSGFSLSEAAISKLFKGERKDVQTKFIGLTDIRYATPYKVTEVKKEDDDNAA